MIFDRKVIVSGILFFFVFMPAFLWLRAQPLSLRFGDGETIFRSIGQLCGLLGVALFALNFLLAARIRIFDNLFAGLNRVYIDHHTVGASAFILLLMHPVALVMRFLTVSLSAAGGFLFSAISEPSIIFGTVGLFLMMGLLILTFYIQLRYHVWKFSHKFLTLAFLFGFFHMIVIPSDVSVNMPLRWYMVALGVLAVLAILYRVLLSNIFVRRYSYVVQDITFLNEDCFAVILAVTGKSMRYRAGQFAYFRFLDDPNISSEEHPFSIASNPGDSVLKIVIKNLGDYTAKIKNLKKGTRVSVEGPYGIFLKDAPQEQIWIAGGIGITPFLGKLASVSADCNISLFYCVHNKDELIYREVFERVTQKTSRFRFIPWFSKESGHISASAIKEVVGAIPRYAEISVCGPASFMENLRSQFVALGVDKKNIKSEEFSL